VSTYLGTASPGDVWNFSLNRTAGTFTGTTDGGTTGKVAYTVAGTLTVMKFGFLKLVATTFTNGTQTAPTVLIDGTHNAAYAMEIPGVALLVQPIGGKSMITAVYNSGTCTVTGLGTPGNGVALTYMRVSYGSSTFDPTANPAFGSIALTPSTGFTSFTPTIENDYILSTTPVGLYTQVAAPAQSYFKYTYGFSAPGQAIGTAMPCTNGVITNGTSTGVIASASGGANAILVDNGPGQGGMVIMAGTAASTYLPSVSFNGLVFKNNSNSTQPIRITFDSTGTKGTVYPITGDPNTTTLTLGTAIAFIKINSATTSTIDASNCTDATFSSCTLGPIGGFLASPSGTNFGDTNNGKIPLILALTGKDNGGTAPFVVFAINTQN
jgi:hypothetical protein